MIGLMCFNWKNLRIKCLAIPCINAFYLKINILVSSVCSYLALDQDSRGNTSFIFNTSMNDEVKMKENFMKCLGSTEIFIILIQFINKQFLNHKEKNFFI